jgi:lipoprotein NlpI
LRGLAAARLAIAYAQIGDASNEAHWQKESVTSINQSPQVRQKVIWSDIEEIVLQLDN